MIGALLLPLLVVAAAAAPSAAAAAAPCVPGVGDADVGRVVAWSAWSGRPSDADADVTVPADAIVLLDVSPPRIKSLSVLGVLTVNASAGASIKLEAHEVYAEHGSRIALGTRACPVRGKLEVVLYGDITEPTVNTKGTGTKCIGVLGEAQLDIHGAPLNHTWTLLDATAPRGQEWLLVADDVADQWPVDAEIAVASSEYHDLLARPEVHRAVPPQSESRVITHVSRVLDDATGAFVGTNISFRHQPLHHEHYGKVFRPSAAEDGNAMHAIDMRAEVVLLSRNVVVRGDTTSAGACRDVDNPFQQPARGAFGDTLRQCWGAHIMVLHAGAARIAHTEFTAAGQAGALARYPVHFHVARNQSHSYVDGNAFHDTFQRCVTVHGTDYLLVRDNVAFNTSGHCYFIEDGDEVENVFVRNVGIDVRPHTLLVADHEPAVFWITSPRNHFYENRAVGGAFGYWYAMPAHPLGAAQNAETEYRHWPQFTPMGDFARNVAHGAANAGVMVDRGVEDNEGNARQLTSYAPRDWAPFVAGVADDELKKLVTLPRWRLQMLGTPVWAVLADTTVYKCTRGIWARGDSFLIVRARLADNVHSVTVPGEANVVVNSTFIGETDNWRAPVYDGVPEWVVRDTKHRPNFYWPSRPLIGYQSYDASGGNSVLRSDFFDFHDEPDVPFDSKGKTRLRRTGALGAANGEFVLNTQNRFLGVRFFDVDNRVHLNHLGFDDEEFNVTQNAMKGLVFVDADGSLTGTCGSRIVGSSSLLRTDACEPRYNWTAYVCPPSLPAHHHLEIEERYGMPLIGTPEQLVPRTGLTLTRLADRVSDLVHANVDEYPGDEQAYQRRWYTNLLAGHEYYAIVGIVNELPKEMTIKALGMRRGELIDFHLHYKAGTKLEVHHGAHRAASRRVTSVAELAYDAYMYDEASGRAHVRLAAGMDDTEWAHYGTYAMFSGRPQLWLKATSCSATDCGHDSIDIPARTLSEAPAGVLLPMCTARGPLGGKVRSFVVRDTPAPAVLIGAVVDDGGGADGGDGDGDSGGGSGETLRIAPNFRIGSEVLGLESVCGRDDKNKAALRCNFEHGANWLAVLFEHWNMGAEAVDLRQYTHMHVRVRAAPRMGFNNRLGVGLRFGEGDEAWNKGPHAMLHDARHGPGWVSDAATRNYYVPLAALGLGARDNFTHFYAAAFFTDQPRRAHMTFERIAFVAADERDEAAPEPYPPHIAVPLATCAHSRCAGIAADVNVDNNAGTTANAAPPSAAAAQASLLLLLLLLVGAVLLLA